MHSNHQQAAWARPLVTSGSLAKTFSWQRTCTLNLCKAPVQSANMQALHRWRPSSNLSCSEAKAKQYTRLEIKDYKTWQKDCEAQMQTCHASGYDSWALRPHPVVKDALSSAGPAKPQIMHFPVKLVDQWGWLFTVERQWISLWICWCKSKGPIVTRWEPFCMSCIWSELGCSWAARPLVAFHGTLCRVRFPMWVDQRYGCWMLQWLQDTCECLYVCLFVCMYVCMYVCM